MNRGEIVTRVEKRIERDDATTTTLLQSFLDEVRQDVEKVYPFGHMYKTKTATMTADVYNYTLPTDLILHHPFHLYLQDESTSTSYAELTKMDHRKFDLVYDDAAGEGDGPSYYIVRGHDVDVYPKPSTARTLRVRGYFYTGDYAGDSDSDYVTNKYQDVLIEGTTFKALLHFGESERANEALKLYQAYMNGNAQMGVVGIIQAEKKLDLQDRFVQVKTRDDFPLSYARRAYITSG